MQKFGTAIILAGGKSSRMGFDKQLLELDGEWLVGRTIRMLRKEFDEIIIPSYREELYKGWDVKVIPDIVPERGPLGGIYTGLKACGSEFAYVIGCDMPYICSDYIRYMKERISKTDAEACVTRKDQWIESLNAFYSPKTLPVLSQCLEEGISSIYGFLRRVHCLFIEEADAKAFSSDWSMFWNLNSLADLEKMNIKELDLKTIE